MLKKACMSNMRLKISTQTADLSLELVATPHVYHAHKCKGGRCLYTLITDADGLLAHFL